MAEAEMGRTLADDDMDDDFRPPPPLPDGVKKEVITEAPTSNWRKPKAGDDCTVHYVGTFEDGSQFDSSRDRGETVSFPVGKGQVIKGWDLGIPTMSKGEVAKFTISPEYAYGEAGSPPTIPPKATLTFEVELVSFISKSDLFGDGNCEKAVVEEGSDWKHPKEGDEIRVSVKATAASGDVVEEHSGIDYVVGSGALNSLSAVVDKTLSGMSKGGTTMVKCVDGYLYPGSSHGAVSVEIKMEEMYETSDVSVMEDKTVMKKIIQEGDTPMANDGWKVTMRVENVTDGKKTLEGFTEAKELRLMCGDGDVCDPLDLAAVTMRKGERAVITCTKPAKCSEAKLGLPDLSKSGLGKVVFTVELTEVVQGRQLYEMSGEEKVFVATLRKDTGGKLFRNKRFEMALKKYQKVIEMINQTDKLPPETKQEANELKKTAELNKAACYLQLHEWGKALTSCNVVLKEDRNNAKALYRRAKAQHERNENVEAEKDLEKLLELQPDNTDAKALLPVVKKAQKVADKESKDIFGNMCKAFGKLPQQDRSAKPKPKPAPKKEEPEDPMAREMVDINFRLDQKIQPGEKLLVVGSVDELGNWELAKGIPMTKAHIPVDLMAMARAQESNKPPPQNNVWEASLKLPQSMGRVEYRYVLRRPSGDEMEDGNVHVLQLGGMGGSRARCKDEWRKKGAGY
eukprot:TRINITY_DN112560_c0_g1_i1.p1 TRINITY_DN112560_c0_g1~~TRINITY_DN112560_c0_g1_i1.p1  ORF type:complete len:683 (+),score=240.93 TRINITY_DN112560_c0_g1_i1:134-2182(+)